MKSAFPRDALTVDGAVQGRLCSMLVDSGSAVTLLSEWVVTVELGYELAVLLALRQSEDIVGPSGEPLELVGALETDLVFREMDRRQSVWVVRGMEYDCLVGRDVLLGCRIISDDTDVTNTTICIRVGGPEILQVHEPQKTLITWHNKKPSILKNCDKDRKREAITLYQVKFAKF